MRTQPFEPASFAATEMAPRMPGTQMRSDIDALPQPAAKKPLTLAQALRAARARVLRLKSLRKQRNAQKIG